MRQGINQEQIQQHIDRHSLQANTHRRFGVVARIKPRRQHFNQHKTQQTCGISLQAHTHFTNVVSGGFAMIKIVAIKGVANKISAKAAGKAIRKIMRTAQSSVRENALSLAA